MKSLIHKPTYTICQWSGFFHSAATRSPQILAIEKDRRDVKAQKAHIDEQRRLLSSDKERMEQKIDQVIAEICFIIIIIINIFYASLTTWLIKITCRIPECQSIDSCTITRKFRKGVSY